MSNILSLKRRISGAQNVSKTTRAMQMIAASKLKRAQNSTLKSRPYSERLMEILQNIVVKIEPKFYSDYMKTSDDSEDKNLLIIFAPDKGLCGGLIGNIVDKILDYNSNNKNTIYVTVGKKIERYVLSFNKEITASFMFGTTLPAFEMVYPLTAIINDYFLGRKVKSVKILYSKFINVFSQKQDIIDLLPIKFTSIQTIKQSGTTLFEPSLQILLPTIIKHYLETVVFQNLLESYASEQAARMLSMQNATNNAVEITNALKLEYNKARQEKITNEILDIGSAVFSYNYE